MGKFASFIKSKVFCTPIILMLSFIGLALLCDINGDFEPHLITFVMGIMTASAALLAIGLAVLQMLLSDISRSYNSEVQKLVLGKKHIDSSFYLFIFTIFLSSILIVIPSMIVEIFVLFVTAMFLISLGVFAAIVLDISKVRNPINNIDFLYNTIMEGIQEDADKE